MNLPNAFADTIHDGFLPNADLMERPLTLVETDEEGGLILNEETVNLLHHLDTPVVVVSVVGTYRSGKSYLMNLLAGKKTGFEIGTTVQSKTKGIWIWCRPHPTLPETTLILMDTEGLDDVAKGDDNYDMQIIVLALLLSSTFIYNTTGRVDNALIKQLGFVTELTKHIQVSIGSNDDDANFDLYFPTLVVTVRDFYLDLELDGNKVTANEYFENCLTLRESNPKKGRKTQQTDFNEPRIKIRKYFQPSKRHCWVLPQPTKTFNPQHISSLDELANEDMNPEFIVQCAKYQQLIVDISQRKSFGQCDKVNGRMFADMASQYVTAVQSGEIPCIQSALRMTAIQENQRVLRECIAIYDKEIDAINMPVDHDVLERAHNEIVETVTKQFKNSVIFEEADGFREEFEGKVIAAYNSTVAKNGKASAEKCQNILQDLNRPIANKMMDKTYLVSGGYDIYMEHLNELKSNYNLIRDKGVKSDEVLMNFLQQKQVEVNNIIAIDRQMTAVKVQEEAAKRLQEEVERREKMLREEINASKQREITMQKTIQETNAAMKEEMNQRLKQQQEEYQRTMAERQKTHDKLAKELNDKIDNLTRPPLPPSGGGGGCNIL